MPFPFPLPRALSCNESPILLTRSRADGVTIVVGSHAEVPNHDIIGVNAEIAFDRDSVSGSGLSGYRDVISFDSDVSIDSSRHLENYNAWPLGVTGRLEAARTRGIQIGHRNYLAATPACGLGAVTFRSGKCGDA